MKDLFSDYLSGASDLMAFFQAPPASFLEVPPNPAGIASELVEDINRFNGNLGSSGRLTGHEALVVTGQQTGLLTGPLYTIHKAATAIRLARACMDHFDLPCAPVFWLAGDDHDFEEARSATIFTRDNDLLDLRYEPEAGVAELPMYRVPLEASLHGLIDEAAAAARGSELAREVSAFLHESLDVSSSLADWTARILARLFRDTPLVLFAPHLPTARRLAADVFHCEIGHPGESTRLLNSAGERLRQAGYHQQVEKRANECNFFIEMGGRRRKVTFDGDRFVIPAEGIACSAYEMQLMLESAPDRFSGNVALRCIVQQRLLSPAAYVAGPGEVAYWAELKPLFAWFGETMPIVYPRARITLTTAKLGKLLSKLGLALGELGGAPEVLLNKALEATADTAWRAVVSGHRPSIRAALAALKVDLTKVVKSAEPLLDGLLTQVESEIDRIERILLRGDEERVRTVEAQVQRLCNALYSRRKPQDRVHNVFSYLFAYGWDLVPRLVEEIDVTHSGVQEIEL